MNLETCILLAPDKQMHHRKYLCSRDGLLMLKEQRKPRDCASHMTLGPCYKPADIEYVAAHPDKPGDMVVNRVRGLLGALEAPTSRDLADRLVSACHQEKVIEQHKVPGRQNDRREPS